MISIITASYNRGYIISKLYESLEKQSIKNFEWIFIDDGSTDNTQELVKKWQSQTKSFVIRYVYQVNGGKHRAVNRGVEMAKYDYCFIVDSDDYLVDEAIEYLHEWIGSIDNNNAFAGVAGLKGYINGGQVGGYPRNKCFDKYIDGTNLERKKFSLGGDKAEVYRTEILKKYPFPEFTGENFLTEEVVWDAIARDGYKLRWFNEIIYLCEYIDDGLTQMGEKILIDNFAGYTYATSQRMKLHGFLAKHFAAGQYVSIARKKGLKLKYSAKKLGAPVAEIALSYLIWHAKNCIKLLIKFIKCRSNDNSEVQ